MPLLYEDLGIQVDLQDQVEVIARPVAGNCLEDRVVGQIEVQVIVVGRVLANGTYLLAAGDDGLSRAA